MKTQGFSRNTVNEETQKLAGKLEANDTNLADFCKQLNIVTPF